ncbi:hypothetical protein K3725_04940 [Leisingera sp. S132]|uniref:hypothetical protein n=1 Tax=Leisingera sp. S132 TaxID=2867016 RepID=UPI0021A33C67|nr:hypothetical protein [Leisingera sp. S132]UWQ80361.1 hypothetical protein K3725_04940 [Leisingera sp. S132]
MPFTAAAEEARLVRLHAPKVLEDSGLLRHILPRFTLKTQVKVELVGLDAADLILGAEGEALFAGAGATWHMQRMRQGHQGADKLAGWLRSEVGRRAIRGFAPEGVSLFAVVEAGSADPVSEGTAGDAALGLEVAQAECSRCHVVAEGAGIAGIGSTPSFRVLRSLADWEERFAAFYALNPHPAFTVVEEVTEPFPEDRPPPVYPVTLTLEDLEALLAYAAALAPADLGAPLQHQ